MFFIEQCILCSDSNYQTHSERQLKNQIRDRRVVAGSRRHLRLGDAHQVANYFLTGGPLKGHAHFVKERNCDPNNNENSVVGMSNPISNNTQLNIHEDESNTNSSDSIVGAPHILAPHLLHSVVKPALNALTGAPNSLPEQGLLRSILHPNLHPHIDALHNVPGNLVRTATSPLTGLMQARSDLRNMLASTGPLLGSTNRASQRAKTKTNLRNILIQPKHLIHPIHSIHHPIPYQIHHPIHSVHPVGYPIYPTHLVRHPPIVGLAPMASHDNISSSSMIHPQLLTPHPQPTGYIVRYVPHSKQAESSPVVGSPQQPLDCTDNNLNIKDVADSTDSKNESTNENKVIE